MYFLKFLSNFIEKSLKRCFKNAIEQSPWCRPQSPWNENQISLMSSRRGSHVCTFDFKRKNKSKNRLFSYKPCRGESGHFAPNRFLQFAFVIALILLSNKRNIQAKFEDKVKWEIILPMNVSRSLIYFVFRQTMLHYITHDSSVFYTMWFHWRDQWKQVQRSKFWEVVGYTVLKHPCTCNRNM